MRHATARAQDSAPTSEERRHEERQTLVLRVGLLEYHGHSTFCLVKNISSKGVKVRLHGSIAPRTEVSLRISDEDTIRGRVAWARGGVTGISFDHTLDPGALLRVKERAAPDRRRIAPRLTTTVPVTFQTGGIAYPAALCNISTSGAQIRLRELISVAGDAALILPGLPSFRVFVRWTRDEHLGLVFQAPIPIQVITDWLGSAALNPSLTR